MKRWGLRWFFCWISVLITAACGQHFASPTPTQNRERTPTLQNYTPPLTPSALPIIRPIITLTPPYSATAMRLSTVAPNLYDALELPTCYETAVQSLICLGWLNNSQSLTLTNTYINFYLLNLQGEILQASSITPVVGIITPQSGSPYRAIFDHIPDEQWVPYAEIAYANTESATPLPIRIELVRQDWHNESYSIEGQVFTTVYPQVRVIISIRDTENHITGFRTIETPIVSGIGTFELNLTPLNQQRGEILVSIEPS